MVSDALLLPLLPRGIGVVPGWSATGKQSGRVVTRSDTAEHATWIASVLPTIRE